MSVNFRRSMALASAIVFVDVGTKVATSVALSEGQRYGVVQPLRNDEVLMGLASGSPTVLVVVGAALLCGFMALCAHLVKQGRISTWIPAVVAGGAVANLADRAITGSVHDWLVLGGIVVNLADLAVWTAVIGYAIGMFRSRGRKAELPGAVLTRSRSSLV